MRGCGARFPHTVRAEYVYFVSKGIRNVLFVVCEVIGEIELRATRVAVKREDCVTGFSDWRQPEVLGHRCAGQLSDRAESTYERLVPLLLIFVLGVGEIFREFNNTTLSIKIVHEDRH